MNVLAENNGPRAASCRARTRAAIIDAAERAFAEFGYRRTRMEDGAEHADVAVGSIYRHFGNKDGLSLAVVERAVELFAPGVAGTLAGRAAAGTRAGLERTTVSSADCTG
jgi:AcrR family transcriptional regulator